MSSGKSTPENSEKTPLRLSPLSIKNENETSKNSSDIAKQQWSSSREFLLSCVAMSVGLGNVWRFPYTAYENGGGAFLIPYFIMLFLVGRSIYFLELILGQFSGMGVDRVWKEVLPIFRGIGIAQMLCGFYIATYYASLIALAIFYFLASFAKVLPWTVCESELQQSSDGTYHICKNNESSAVSPLNETYDNKTQNNIRIISPAEQYFLYNVLKSKDNIEDGIGIPDVRLSGCLALCYILLFFIMCKGIVSSGKVWNMY